MSHKSVSLQPFPMVQICLKSLGVISYNRWALSEGHKIISRVGVLWTHTLPFCFWPIFNSMNHGHIIKGCKPRNFTLQNSLKLSFINIWGLSSNFVDCDSFLKWQSPDIFALCETNLDDSIDSGNFSVMGYPPLIQKDSTTHMHGFTVYVNEGLPFAQNLFLENPEDSYLCFRLAIVRKRFESSLL